MKKQQACPPERRGSGLIFAVILLFVILGMVITLSSITVLETKMSQKTKSSVGAFFSAESGVEWALNQIANTANPDSTTVQSKFGLATDGSKDCPFGGCSVYFLKSDGKVITQTEASSLHVSDIKAVRSVGTQNVGGIPDTSRSIEAAVAAGTLTCEKKKADSATPVPCGATSSVNCPSGEIAVSGGAEDASNVSLQKSYPLLDAIGTPIGWTVVSYNVSGGGGCIVNNSIRAIAICCKIN